MKKLSWLIAIFAILALVFGGLISCDNNTTKPGNTPPTSFNFVLDDNFRYDHAYQSTMSVFDRIGRIAKGTEYTLKITFTASRDLEAPLKVGFVDPVLNWWTPLSDGDNAPVINGAGNVILKDEVVTAEVKLVATGTASTNTAATSHIYFWTRGKSTHADCTDACQWTDDDFDVGAHGTPGNDSANAGGTGKEGPVTLKFTNFQLTVSQMAAPCCDDCDPDCEDCIMGNCEDNCNVTCCLPPPEVELDESWFVVNDPVFEVGSNVTQNPNGTFTFTSEDNKGDLHYQFPFSEMPDGFTPAYAWIFYHVTDPTGAGNASAVAFYLEQYKNGEVWKIGSQGNAEWGNTYGQTSDFNAMFAIDLADAGATGGFTISNNPWNGWASEIFTVKFSRIVFIDVLPEDITITAGLPFKNTEPLADGDNVGFNIAIPDDLDIKKYNRFSVSVKLFDASNNEITQGQWDGYSKGTLKLLADIEGNPWGDNQLANFDNLGADQGNATKNLWIGEVVDPVGAVRFERLAETKFIQVLEIKFHN